MPSARNWVTWSFALAVATTAGAPSAALACDICAVYTATEQSESRPGPRFGVATQYTHFGTLQNGSEEVPNPFGQRLDSVITQVVLGWQLVPRLGVQLNLPFIYRDFRRIENGRGTDGTVGGFGDMSLLANALAYSAPVGEQGLFRLNLLGGLKLPTGKFDVTNEQGEVAERSLQPGTGTTDLILTAYFREALPQFDSSWFVQAGTQLPLNSRDQYKPGNQFGFDAGYRYDATDKLGLMLQANFRWKGRDSGAQAEPEDSGGRSITLSPGISYAFTPNVQVYGYVQLPLYQYVNGVQLTADWSAVAGISAQF